LYKLFQGKKVKKNQGPNLKVSSKYWETFVRNEDPRRVSGKVMNCLTFVYPFSLIIFACY